MKEFEVRATGPNGEIFRIVRADEERQVFNYFRELCFWNIYIQEVPLSDYFTIQL